MVYSLNVGGSLISSGYWNNFCKRTDVVTQLPVSEALRIYPAFIHLFDGKKKKLQKFKVTKNNQNEVLKIRFFLNA